MVPPEVRTYRNWPLMIYSAFGGVAFAVCTLGRPPLVFLVIPCAGAFLAGLRQRVTVTATDVELGGMFGRRTVAFSEIRALTVRYSSLNMWWIVLHRGDDFAETFTFFAPGFRQLPASFTEPPSDAPAPVKHLFAVLAARIAAQRRRQST